MRSFLHSDGRSSAWLALITMALTFGLTGCAGGNSLFASFGTPFTFVGGSTTDGTTDDGDDDGSSLFDGGGRGTSDPCSESLIRKFIRITKRNHNPDDFIHYFLV